MRSLLWRLAFGELKDVSLDASAQRVDIVAALHDRDEAPTRKALGEASKLLRKVDKVIDVHLGGIGGIIFVRIEACGEEHKVWGELLENAIDAVERLAISGALGVELDGQVDHIRSQLIANEEGLRRKKEKEMNKEGDPFPPVKGYKLAT